MKRIVIGYWLLMFTCIAYCNDIEHYEITCKPTDEKVFIEYSKVIRERIKTKLHNVYRKEDGSGEVDITFVLSSKGKLMAFTLTSNSMKNKRLQEITIQALQNASFPPFPIGFDYNIMSFKVEVIYKL